MFKNPFKPKDRPKSVKRVILMERWLVELERKYLTGEMSQDEFKICHERLREYKATLETRAFFDKCD